MKTLIENAGDYARLYKAANDMAAELTMHGTLTVNSGSFERLWELLYTIDGGTYQPDANFIYSDELKAEIVFNAKQQELGL